MAKALVKKVSAPKVEEPKVKAKGSKKAYDPKLAERDFENHPKFSKFKQGAKE